MYQKIIIVGNLGGNPEMKYTPDALAVTTFSVATSEVVKGEKHTTWWRVTVFGKQAEACNQYLRKGSKVVVEGRIKSGADGSPHVFQRKDGSWGASYELTAENVRFMDSKPEPDDAQADDEVPF